MQSRFVTPHLARLSALTLALLPLLSQAGQLYDNGTTQISYKLSATLAAMHSSENYAQSGNLSGGDSDWQEGVLQYGVDITHALRHGSLYGALNWTSTASWEDGDAAGFSNGSERTTKIEDAYAGWRSGDLVPALGEDGIDFSVGRQYIQVGDGFLIAGDALNVGNGIADGLLNRGGAYYLAGRKDFDQTAVLRLGGQQGWRGDLMWLKSDNPSQARPTLAVATLEQVAAEHTLGATYIRVADTDDALGAMLYPQRKGERVYSLRASGNVGVPELFLSGEFAQQQRSDDDDENAWYAEAGWTFTQLPWQPQLSYRYSRFSSGYDPLFYGNGRDLGTWFQGEVAANYAGPFNTNARVHHLGLKLTPTDQLSLGVLAYRFDTIDTSNINLDGNEVDLYGVWQATEKLTVIPLLGFYRPGHDASEGGSQLGNRDRNLYAQLILSVNY